MTSNLVKYYIDLSVAQITSSVAEKLATAVVVVIASASLHRRCDRQQTVLSQPFSCGLQNALLFPLTLCAIVDIEP